MIQQIGQVITAYAFYTESKLGKTGLTVTCNVRSGDNTLVVNGAAATESGDGLYEYSYTTEAAGNFKFVFKTSTTTVDAQDIPALWVVGLPWVEKLDATVTSRATATALATVDTVVDGIAATLAPSTIVPTSASVSTDGGTLYLVRGNSYQTGQGWTPPSWAYTGSVPDLTGADVYLRLPGAGDIAMTVTAISGGYDLDVDLTAEETGSINGDDWEIVAKWVTAGVVTGQRRLLQGVIDWS